MMKLTILDNGLKVASRTMPGVETVAVGLYAEAGSRHEPARVNGIAHLFEHMVFKGAGNRSAREISEAIEDVGGDLNACTDRDQTSFTASLLAEHLPLGIELLADMILRPRFAADDLAREKEVVLQELAEARDTPSDIIFDDLWMAAFPTSRSAARSSVTRPASAAIAVDDLHAWQADHYRAGGLTLVAAGKVEHDALVRLAEERFAALPEGTPRDAEPARFGGRHPDEPAEGRPGPSRRRLCRAGHPRARLLSGAPVQRPHRRAAPPRACSRRCARTGGWPIRSGRRSSPIRDAGLFYLYAATARREAAAAAALIAEVVAEAARQRDPARARPGARAGQGRPAHVARKLLGPGRLCRPPARRSTDGSSSPPRWWPSWRR